MFRRCAGGSNANNINDNNTPTSATSSRHSSMCEYVDFESLDKKKGSSAERVSVRPDQRKATFCAHRKEWRCLRNTTIPILMRV